MARYSLAVAIAGAPPNGQYAKYIGGTKIADTVGNALLGDVIWPALTGSPNRNQLIPLDASAAAALGGTIGVFSPGSGCVGQGASDGVAA